VGKKCLLLAGTCPLIILSSGVDLRRIPRMPGLDLQNLTLTIVAIAAVRSLIFKFLKRLGKEIESVALVWIRVYKRIKAEKNKR
jgi:hypothetical protein